MRIVLENSWRRVELMDRWEEVGPWEPGARTLTLLPAGESARQFLSRFLQDGKVMSALRMLLRWRTESASLAGRNGHGVLDEICRRLALGDFLLVQFELRPRPYLTTPAEPAPAPPPPAAPAPIPPAEEPPHKQCSNPACKPAFQSAAENGTPLVQRGADCGC